MQLHELDTYETPKIKLTKSLNKTTGTVTFIFSHEIIFQLIKKKKITQLTIKLNQLWIYSNNTKIKFRAGKPVQIFFIFLIKNSQEWNSFITFLLSYAKLKKLTFKNL